jgi:hypothetical protein
MGVIKTLDSVYLDLFVSRYLVMTDSLGKLQLAVSVNSF